MSHNCIHNLNSCVTHGAKNKINEATLEAAKQYADSQRLAYAEGRPPITWDGNIEGKAILPGDDNICMVHITNNIIDLSKVVKCVTATRSPDGYVAICGEETDFMLINNYPMTALADTSGNSLLVTIAEDLEIDTGMTMPKGTHVKMFQVEGGGIFISEIHFAETIHPIEPKFIPPMDSITLNGADGKQYKLAVDENGSIAATPIE